MLVKAIQEMCITHVQEFKKIYLTLFFTAKFLMLQYIIQAQENCTELYGIKSVPFFENFE